MREIAKFGFRKEIVKIVFNEVLNEGQLSQFRKHNASISMGSLLGRFFIIVLDFPALKLHVGPKMFAKVSRP